MKFLSEVLKNPLVVLERYRHFLVYSIIGATGATLDFVIFFALFNYVGIDKNIATFLSTTAGITNNFVLNIFFNFKTKDKLLYRYFSFYSIGFLGILITFGIFYLFVDLAGFSANIVKAASIVVVVLVQYNLNKRISFK